jgi:hypothetical protein
MESALEGIAVLVQLSNEHLDLNSHTVCLILSRAWQQKGADDCDATKSN